MISIILDLLTNALLIFLAAAAIVGVIAFVLAVTWIQATEGRRIDHEPEASAPESGVSAPASQRKRRRAAQGYPA